MIVKDNVPIEELVKKFFREIYGVEIDELYRNDELCKKIRFAARLKGRACLTKVMFA